MRVKYDMCLVRIKLSDEGAQMKNFNGLTPAQTERLAYLAEECAEVIQIVGKILRHGYNSHDPTDPYKEQNTTYITSNRIMLEIELADINKAVFLMDNNEDISIKEIQKRSENAHYKYMHHQEGVHK